MTRAQKIGVLFAIAASLAFPRAARAQTPSGWDLFAGYSFLRDTPQDLNLSAGWTLGVATRLNRWFSIVADGSGNYKTVPLIGSELRLNAHSLMVGGRASVKMGEFVEFVQLLAGPVRTHGTVFGLSNSETHMAAQGGIGLDAPLWSRLVARVEFDGRFLSTGREFRALVGVAYVSR